MANVYLCLWQMSICVCAKCKKTWKAPGSPARCSHCGQVSFAIAIQMGSQVISTANEWSHNPEYRATQSVVIKPPTAETRAKLSASSKKLWQDPEYRARQIATHTGRHPSPQTKAKISAAITRRHNKKVKLREQTAITLVVAYREREGRGKFIKIGGR
ncbi:hypothetical protein ES705_49145 [subsurface metagenome]